jgi:hypothetical protein
MTAKRTASRRSRIVSTPDRVERLPSAATALLELFRLARNPLDAGECGVGSGVSLERGTD